MAKRKYTRRGEQPSSYKCANRKCKWEGSDQEWEQIPRKLEPYITDAACPKCGNKEFYGLL